MTTTKPEPSTPNATPASPTWRILVRDALKRCGGVAPLAILYSALSDNPRAKINPHWKAKIRQCVQLDPLIERVEKGVWRLKP
jgi:hypothetical protein